MGYQTEIMYSAKQLPQMLVFCDTNFQGCGSVIKKNPELLVLSDKTSLDELARACNSTWRTQSCKQKKIQAV